MPDFSEPFRTIEHKRWTKKNPPKKILVMRLQALGDTVITLPYLQSLRRQYHDVEIHFLTRREVSQIPLASNIFDRVFILEGARSVKRQLIYALLKLPFLKWKGYDVVIDLQNNRLSKLIRRLLKPDAWSAFDTQSPLSAGLRTKLTIEAIGIWNVHLDKSIHVDKNVNDLLINAGWKQNTQLVVLNPAGSLPSRSWPVENYIQFARYWLNEFPDTQFVLLLLPSVREKANQILSALGAACIDLTGNANQVEAFAIIHKSAFVLSEDSGLMHMAWVQGIPTLALFSSSRKDWSAPQGDWSECLDSSDMACGPCDLAVCQFGDNRCLTRYEPSFVFERSLALVRREMDV